MLKAIIDLFKTKEEKKEVKFEPPVLETKIEPPPPPPPSPEQPPVIESKIEPVIVAEPTPTVETFSPPVEPVFAEPLAVKDEVTVVVEKKPKRGRPKSGKPKATKKK